MNWLDWLIIVLYLIGLIALGAYLTRKQRDIRDYYLADKTIRWWQSGASTMATQLGAVSFISAPAFVALKQGGGLKWLCYEFGVPLALILVMAVIIPIFHQHNYVSIYEYLEDRFDGGTRSLISVLFQIGRGLATAVTVLAGGLVVSTAMGLPLTVAIVVIGLVTLIYDVLGGIEVVILSDVVQMVLIVAGIGLCAGFAIYDVGWHYAWQVFDPGRLKILDFQHLGLKPEGHYAFWPMLIGGFFLYASYYGCDQSQVQRELTVGSVDDVRKSLLVNAIGRFPLVLMYSVMGILVGAIFVAPETLGQVSRAMEMSPAAIQQLLARDPDRMLPMFILSYLPNGVIGLIFVAIMAAMMSSLDSALNSLSAVTMRDVYQRYVNPRAGDREYLIASKLITLFWGLFCIGAALAFASFGESTRHTTIVLINAVGSMLYGPILGAFLLGMFVSRVDARAVKLGVVAGIATNLLLWQFTSISWLWWNFTGFAATALAALTAAARSAPRHTTEREDLFYFNRVIWPTRKWRIIYLLVAGYFVLIVLVSYGLQSIRG
ncbi:MAG: sodium transporter [Calditrichaeota bacterium]|nr:MAG: sodium transporter [Calditrichota bacterium]